MYKLRELYKDDLVEINRWRNDKNLIDNLGAQFRYINLGVDEKWYETYMASRQSTVRCAIVDANDMIVGIVGLVNINHLNQSAVFNIMIGKNENQNKGIGTFATKEMLKHAFYNLNLNRVELSVLEYNERAIRMYEKCGFVREGKKRQVTFKNGKFIDMYIYSILRAEFIY
ncbi:MAG: GNAT family N-acetyltransferase [Clostridia bacterium]|nr:GNAT family N-acetyltransferase [Clostridia bacterium]